MISRWTRLIPILALALALGWPGLAPAATIDYYASGFNSQSWARAENSAAEPEIADSGTHVDQNSTNAATVPSAVVSDPEVGVYADNFGRHESSGDNNRYVEVYASVWGYSYDAGGVMQAYGNANTVTPAVTNGIFFLINPSPGENVGDPVTLSWEWYGQMDTGEGATAQLTGGYLDNIAITLNDYAPPSVPDPAKTIWSYDGQVLGEEQYFQYEEYGEHLAHIGDIIGVHLGAYADIDLMGEAGSYTSSSQSLDLYVDTNPVPIPGAVWLLGSGLVGLAGLRRKLKR